MTRAAAEQWGRAYYTYFDWPVGGVIYQFCTMGVPIAREYVINRAIKKPAVRVRTRLAN